MRCLIVDSDIGFSTVLSEALQALGYEVEAFPDGISALRAAEVAVPDLVFLDEALNGPDAATVARRLRELNPTVRLMVISSQDGVETFGDDGLSVQGTLPRPFYAPELPARVAAAMAAPVNGVDAGTVSCAEASDPSQAVMDGGGSSDCSTSRGAAAHPPAVLESAAQDNVVLSRRLLRMHQPELEALMRELALEVGAESVLLTRDREVLMAVGRLDISEAASIADAVYRGWQASTEVARALGKEQVRFEQSITGGSYMLYVLNLLDALLVVTVSGTTPLGLLRHRTRSAAREIAVLCMG